MTFTGALEDTRPQEEKEKDWHKDLATSISLNWIEKDFDEIKSFPVRNQSSSGSCVAQSLALILGIENFLEEGRFIEFSAKDIYTRRTNDGMGMIGVEALDIVRKNGCTLEVLIPSQNQGETEMNKIEREISDIEIAKIFKIKDYYQLPFDINKIATIMESGRKDGVAKPLMVWFIFPRKEWTSIPKISTSTYDMVHHSVVAIDYGILNGEKGIFIQDSWGLHSTTVNGLRFISEDYLQRMSFCAYVNDMPNDGELPARILRFGMKGDDVKNLQKRLNEVLKISLVVDGDFGRKTENSVKNYQSLHGLVADGIVGEKTRAKLYEYNS